MALSLVNMPKALEHIDGTDCTWLPFGPDIMQCKVNTIYPFYTHYLIAYLVLLEL